MHTQFGLPWTGLSKRDAYPIQFMRSWIEHSQELPLKQFRKGSPKCCNRKVFPKDHRSHESHDRAVVKQLFPTSIIAAVGGRCSSTWPDCICLDRNVCESRWGGLAMEGEPGNWPCPSDPANVWGCIISECEGINTWCTWTNTCNNILPNPVCPGGNDFVCCAG
ncbi:hypothetical protein B0J18DRAFT_436700 [Chaetomium sp. MPI-SDFR-AT-0129]|nr:hypothetical protein B0J18DRAFT_436700 [Chaetomium sp. MPI-SDFR-AT-0129]